MNSRPLMILRLTTSPTEEIGLTPHGKLSIFPVTGGSFEGERLRGKVLAGGGDWVTANADGTFELDLRVTLETDDGALVHMTFTGLRDDANHYLRTLPRFETAAPRYRVPQSSARRGHRGDPAGGAGSYHRRDSLKGAFPGPAKASEVEAVLGGDQFNSKRDLPRYVRLIEVGLFDAKTLVTSIFPLDRVGDAFQAAADRTTVASVIVFLVAVQPTSNVTVYDRQ